MFTSKVPKRRFSIVAGLCLAALIILFNSVMVQAQPGDTISGPIRTSGDTIASLPDSIIRKHSPRKAVIYSLICPGLGQIYNKKYWKLPFIYGAGGAFLYYINYNQLKYKKFRDALYDYVDNQNATVVIDGYPYQYSSLPLGRDYYRRYRDWSIAGFAAIYLLNVIDAMVDAHFYYFDISDDLTLKVEPAVIQNTDPIGATASLGFRINLGF